MNDQLPTLSSGLVCLDDEDAPAALYRIVGHHLAAERGPAYWIDARNRATPAAIDRHAGEAAWRSLRVARAFTGYHHYELVRSLPGRVRPNTSLVVAPNLASLYADDDVPDQEADTMAAASLELLSAVATTVDVPVLVTASTAPYAEAVYDAADRVLDAERTDAGLAVEGPSFRTDVYWRDWGFQTTIPYWAELFGTVGEDGAVGTPSVPTPRDAQSTLGV
jgi:hypothetical protein